MTTFRIIERSPSRYEVERFSSGLFGGWASCHNGGLTRMALFPSVDEALKYIAAQESSEKIVFSGSPGDARVAREGRNDG